jgi:enterobactin synthetase component D / holo-[acyl-carrier protein] synthase
VIEEILPAAATAVEAFADPPDVTLFAEEEAVVRRAVDKRRREFTTVRDCARRALAELGYPPAPILPGPRGAPGWPAGVVGSLTHCPGYRAAAVARERDVRSLGIDAEPHEELPEGVLPAIALDAERAMLDRLRADRPATCWDRLLFSAKESVYKAWFPLTGRWLDFAEARIELDGSGSFTARLLVPGPVVDGRQLAGFDGRWLVRNGLIATAVAVA